MPNVCKHGERAAYCWQCKDEVIAERDAVRVHYESRIDELKAELKFPRADSQPLGSGDWVIDVPYLKRIKRSLHETFGGDTIECLDLEEIEQVLLAVEAYRDYPKEPT